MTHYQVQEWPDMKEDGDAIVFSSDWPRGDWEPHEPWIEAWVWLAGNINEGDTVEVLPAMFGERLDSYTPA